MAARRKVAQGTRCKHCDEPVRRYLYESGGTAWLHEATMSVYCPTNVQGHTAKFAEPR